MESQHDWSQLILAPVPLTCPGVSEPMLVGVQKAKNEHRRDALTRDRGGGNILHTALHNGNMSVFAGMAPEALSNEVIEELRQALDALESSDREVIR